MALMQVLSHIAYYTMGIWCTMLQPIYVELSWHGYIEHVYDM